MAYLDVYGMGGEQGRGHSSRIRVAHDLAVVRGEGGSERPRVESYSALTSAEQKYTNIDAIP